MKTENQSFTVVFGSIHPTLTRQQRPNIRIPVMASSADTAYGLGWEKLNKQLPQGHHQNEYAIVRAEPG